MNQQLPTATAELITRFFGAAAQPRYDRALTSFKRDPYRPLFDRLADHWEVEELSDPQYDLGPRWWVTMPDAQSFDVRLSFVGPYFVLLNQSGQLTTSPELCAVLASEGFIFAEQGLLETPVRIWEPEVQGSVYEFLFEFDHGLPWADNLLQ